MKDVIRNTIRDLGKALGFKTLRLEGDSVIIDAGEFITFALKSNGDRNGANDTEKSSSEITPDMIKNVLTDLGGSGSSADIREKLQSEHKIDVDAATIRPILQGMIDNDALTSAGAARGFKYVLPTRKGKK